jgi:uncharacterized protein YoxC
VKLYNEQFLHGLNDDPKVGLHTICSHFMDERTKKKLGLEEHFEALALIEAYVTANEMDVHIPPLPSDRDQQLTIIVNFINETKENLASYIQSEEGLRLLQNYRSEFSVHISKAFVYEFSGGDLDRIQTLLNELREVVSHSTIIEEKHRRRLLKRLERLQQELNKKQSDLDHFWGLVGDAGVALGKFGEDAKPFVDRIKEITDIVWRTQSRAEELPSDSKHILLESDDDDEM